MYTQVLQLFPPNMTAHILLVQVCGDFDDFFFFSFFFFKKLRYKNKLTELEFLILKRVSVS